MAERLQDDRPTITLEFNRNGNYLTAIYFNAASDNVYDALWKSFHRITKDDHIGWIRRLFRRP